MLDESVIRDAIDSIPGDYARWYSAFETKHGRPPSQMEQLDYVTGKDMLNEAAESLRYTGPLFKRLYDR